MIGNYLPITPQEWDRTRSDDEWVLEFAQGLADAEIDAPDSDRGTLAAEKLYRTDKAWDALRFLLLERAGCPVDVIQGEQDFTDEDWGYGPAHLLSAEQVRTASTFLTATTFDALASPANITALIAENAYPTIWDEPDALDWVRRYYDGLTAFFGTAAGGGDAMIVWLN